MKRILLTGGSGLLALNWAITVRSQFEVVLALHNREISLADVKSMKFDTGSRESILKAIGQIRPDLVIHTAGLTSVEDCEKFPDLMGGVYSTEMGELNFIMYDRPCGLYYVHVAASRFPEEPVWNHAAVLDKYQKVKKRLLRLKAGYIARISLANVDDAFDGVNVLPLFRGCGMIVKRHEWIEIE